MIVAYDRAKAVSYAHEWAFKRNPSYYDFELLGGDCTNFASQCLYAGSGVMNFRATFGWYYRSASNRSPSWSGVEYFNQFLQRTEESIGPFAKEIDLLDVEPGDFVQLKFHGRTIFSHNPIVVERRRGRSLASILVAAHSDDSDYRPLSSYTVAEYRPLHILGVRT